MRGGGEHVFISCQTSNREREGATMMERGSPEPCLVSFVLKMCEFMVLPCRPHDLFKTADDIPVRFSPHGVREKGVRESGGQILSFVLPSI